MTTVHTYDQADAAAFRAAMMAFATGVTVVSTGGNRPPCGVTANAFSTVSLAPPLVLVCLSAASSTLREIAANGVFAVNVLSEDQAWLSRGFASRRRARGHSAFGDVAHRDAVTGAPIIEDVACWLDCRVADMHPAGDHVIAIGEVLALGGDPLREPLVFHAGRYRVVSDARRLSPCAPSSAKEVTRHEDVLCPPARDGEDHRRPVRLDLRPPSARDHRVAARAADPSTTTRSHLGGELDEDPLRPQA